MEENAKRRLAKNDLCSPNKKARTDPPFIHYLFTMKHSCFFLVGDHKERIGVYQHSLMAHSEPFRLMLQDSALAERGPVRVPDIQPDTFRNLLRFVYGDNILSTLNMEEAVELMYVAEKYIVEELKPKLSTHICSILSLENVLIPLQRPACYVQNSLKDAIDKNIQQFTDVLLHQPDFLDINMFGVLCIVQQDTLAVSEIELWRGVLKWAKHNAKSEGCATLRELLSGPVKHIRLCTLTLEDFCKEVVLAKLLSDSEVLMIINSISKKIVVDNLTSVCNTIEPRNLCVKEIVKAIQGVSPKKCYSVNHTFFSIFTNQFPITVMSALFECTEHPVLGKPQNLQFQCECNVTVTWLDYSDNNIPYKRAVEFVFEQKLDYGMEFQIPLLVNGECIKLSRHSKYDFSFKFKNNACTSIKCFYCDEFSFDKNLFRSVSSGKEPCCFAHANCGIVKKIVYKLLK